MQQENPIIIKQQQPEIICQKHQSCNYVSIDPKFSEIQNILVCIKCMKEQIGVIQQSVDLVDIYNVDIIENLPYSKEEIIYKQLNKMEQLKSKQQIEETKTLFGIIKNNIKDIIEGIEEQVLNHLKSIEQKKQNIFNMYYQISQKELIRQQITNNQSDLDKLRSGLGEIITEMKKQQLESDVKLKNDINNYIKSLKEFNMQIKKEFIQKIQEQIEQKDFLNLSLQIVQEIQDEQFKVEGHSNQNQAQQLMNQQSEYQSFNSERFQNLEYSQQFKTQQLDSNQIDIKSQSISEVQEFQVQNNQ